MKLPIEIQKVKEHKSIKSQLLKIINSYDNLTSKRSIIDQTFSENISKTDYNLEDESKEYKNIIISNIVPYTYKQSYISQTIDNIWFQQYQKGDTHGWHIHPNCHYSHIYFLDLPIRKYSTEFFYDNKIHKVDVKEGDLISFSSTIIHRSPIIEEDTRKIIVSFNTSFQDIDIDYINKHI